MIQHAIAQQALPIIAAKARARESLTYKLLAEAVGRKPEDNSRFMASVCDLLDAAAMIESQPLMALFTVREESKQFNSKAWTQDTPQGLRDLLLDQAKAHIFTDEDEAAILKGLDRLRGMGNRKAWEHVRQIFPLEVIKARLMALPPPPDLDSLDDLGADEPLVVSTSGRRFVRDPTVRAEVLRRAGGVCEFCGEPGFLKADGTRYLEAHHILALSANGEDRMTNVIGLCPGDHRKAHFAAGKDVMERRMVEIVRKKEARRPYL